MRGAFFIFLLLLFIIVSYGCNRGKENPDQSEASVDLNMELMSLDLEAVKPEGWLLDWAISASKGISGHLDEREIVFEKAWSGESFEARGVGEEGTGWPLEQSAYWLDGLVRLAYILDDSMLIHKAQSRLDPIVEGVLNGGESFIYWRPIDQLNNEFDNWAHSHMGRALVGYYSATRDPRVLEALLKAYSHYIYPPSIPSHFHGVNGMVNLDPIMETYMLSKDSAMLAQITFLAEIPDFKDLIRRWNRDSMQIGHGVIFYENIRIPAILSAVTGDVNHLNATLNALQWAEMDHLLPTGLISSEEFMAGVGSTRNIETCNVAAGAHTINWLLRISGEAKYADKVEQIFFNAGPVPFSRDFQKMCYYQSPNRISLDLPKDEPGHPGEGSYKYDETGHHVLCCIGNSNRIIPNYISNMWMKTKNGGLAAVLHGPSSVSSIIAGTYVTIAATTEYPFEEQIRYSVSPEKKIKFPLHLRIPLWCAYPGITINNEEIIPVINEEGFAIIQRTWEVGDELILTLPMKMELTYGRETEYANIGYFKEMSGAREIAKSHQKIDNPFGTVSYGPLLLALPIPDNGANATGSEVETNFALDLSDGDYNEPLKVEKRSMGRPWHWQLENPPIRITVPAKQFSWNPTKLQPLPSELIAEGKDTSITLVPYGLTKFRVSMFPVTKSSWKEQ